MGLMVLTGLTGPISDVGTMFENKSNLVTMHSGLVR
jgi:hypothetical protein